jgi:hypothetical protein
MLPLSSAFRQRFPEIWFDVKLVKKYEVQHDEYEEEDMAICDSFDSGSASCAA